LASGAEEKLVRVFEATRNFVDNVSAISGPPGSEAAAAVFDDGEALAEGASVPSLGLSNKAVLKEDRSTAQEVLEADKHVKDHYPDHYFKPERYDRPPAEETLVQNTLWPEIGMYQALTQQFVM
jgi:elongator complex protein 2